MNRKLLLIASGVAFAGVGIGTGSAMLSAKPAAKQAQSSAQKPPAPASTKFAALAVDRSKGFAHGWSYDQPTRASAAQVALQECAKRQGKCAVVVEFTGPGCAAYHTLSESDGSAYGWGTAQTRAAAEQRAKLECDNFAGKPDMCSNQVWACNSAEPATFKVLRNDPVRRAKSPKDCLIQYEIQLYDSADDWKSRFYSPVYRLASTDCPIAADSPYHSFYYNVWKGGDIRFGQANDNLAPANPARKERGITMARDFYNWFSVRRSPIPGLKLWPSASVTSSAATDKNLLELIDNTGGHDAGDSAGVADGVCIDFAPAGVSPLEVLGAERCRRWLR